MDTLTAMILTASKWILPALAVWILLRCLRSMLPERYDPELWARLEFSDGSTADVRHWECIIGRSRGCDIVIPEDTVERTHAALIRSDKGKWRIFDLGSEGGTAVGAQRDEGRGLELQDCDVLFFDRVGAVFHPLDNAELLEHGGSRSVPGQSVSQSISLLLLTVFQALLTLQYTVSPDRDHVFSVALAFAALMLLEWCFYFLMRAVDRSGFEIETLAFFLCTLGLAVTASSAPSEIGKHLLLLLAGVLLFLFLGWWLRDLRRTKALRWPVALAALGLLALNLVAGTAANGATNWLSFGGFSLQPSEFVKVAYIYVGAASLDRLYRGRNLFLFIGFSAVCVGALALMGDFGAALIFFAAFLVISFMRSGSFATVFLAVAGAALSGFLVLTVKPYIAQRFGTWGHIWDDPYGAGWQQTRALSAAASGGLLGVGAGRGWLHTIFAADTDMVFCLVSEELGLLIAVCAMLALAAIGFFSVRSAAGGRSSYYVIAACAAASMMLVQLALNVFGSTDILPFTGVTFPFVSRGGSSLISCWMLLAFLKAADTRQNSSFSVRLSARGKYTEEDDLEAEDDDIFDEGESL